MQNALTKVFEWCEVNQLTMNVEKTKNIIFYRKGTLQNTIYPILQIGPIILNTLILTNIWEYC